MYVTYVGITGQYSACVILREYPNVTLRLCMLVEAWRYMATL